MIRGLRCVLGLALGLLIAGTACATPPTPMLWKVSKGDSTVWLLGSMHMLRESDYPLSNDVEDAYHHARKLVFEIAPDEIESPATLAMMMKRGTYPDPKSHKLQDDLPAADWQRLVAYGEKNLLPVEKLQTMRPWMMSMMLDALETIKMGITPDAGLDNHFMKMAATDHKPTAGLETTDQQLALFADSTVKEQDDMLRHSLDGLPDFRTDMEKEHDIWRRGDTEAILAEAKKEFAGYSGVYQKLVAQRNRNWIPQIDRMLDGGSHDTLVIVGALHLPGPDGVVNLLRKQGYRVDRVCTGCASVH